MRYRLRPEAKLDLQQASSFYDSQTPGLGAEFAVDVGIAIARVLDGPSRWPRDHEGYRRYRLDRFPYALIYRAEPQTVDIYAIFDLRRNPDTWRR